jgi:hypothetical protein
MNGNNLYWFQDGFEIPDANCRHSAAKLVICSLKPSLAPSPDLDKISEHAKCFKMIFVKCCFFPAKHCFWGPGTKMPRHIFEQARSKAITVSKHVLDVS